MAITLSWMVTVMFLTQFASADPFLQDTIDTVSDAGSAAIDWAKDKIERIKNLLCEKKITRASIDVCLADETTCVDGKGGEVLQNPEDPCDQNKPDKLCCHINADECGDQSDSHADLCVKTDVCDNLFGDKVDKSSTSTCGDDGNGKICCRFPLL